MEESQEKKLKLKKTNADNLSPDKILHKVFLSNYTTIEKIGSGAFGSIYKAKKGEELYALKFESRANDYEYLEEEAIMMRYLKCPQIPIIKCFGKCMEYNIMVMELLGDSLEYEINIKKKFSVKTVAMLGYQILNILEFIHDRHIIHRDIKPDNLLMGLKEKNAVLYLLDFGLAKKFRSSKTLMQYPFIRKRKMTGTARYASIHAMEEMEQSRRDDLESTAYVLLYFLRGSLPWQGLKVKTKENRYKKILAKKKSIKSEILCETFPEEFKYLVDYTKNLGYTENPDYEKLRNNFLDLVEKKMCRNFDFIYDWTTKTELQIRDEKIDLLNGVFGGVQIYKGKYIKNYNVKNSLENNEVKKEDDEENKNEEGNEEENKKEDDNENKNNNREDEKVESSCCFIF